MDSGCRNPLSTERGSRALLDVADGNRDDSGRHAAEQGRPRAHGSILARNKSGPRQWFCFFQSAAGRLAVPLEFVAEVLETDTLVRLAWTPPQVAGLCLYHREVVTVVLLSASSPGGGEASESGRDLRDEPDPPGERTTAGERRRSLVLILRGEQGAWGVRLESEKTVMSCEPAEHHPPRVDQDGPVVVGAVELDGSTYGILDPEATWRGLRAAVSRWSGWISETYPCSPLASEEEPAAAGLGAPENTGQHEHYRGRS